MRVIHRIQIAVSCETLAPSVETMEMFIEDVRARMLDAEYDVEVISEWSSTETGHLYVPPRSSDQSPEATDA